MRAERVKELKDTKDKAEAKSKKQIEENNKKIQALQKRVCYITMHLCCFLLLSIVFIIMCLLSLVVWDLIEFPCPLGLRCIYRKVREYWSANDWQSCSSVLEET